MELINLYIDDSFEDKSGVSAIALVDSPAIESGWVAFNKALNFGGDGSGCNGDNCGRPDGSNSADDSDHVLNASKKLGLSDGDFSLKWEKPKKGLSGAVSFIDDGSGKYVLSKNVFVDKTKKNYKQVIDHELRHIYQAKNMGFYADKSGFYWKGELHTSLKDYNKIMNGMIKAKDKETWIKYTKMYNDLPWEKDANDFAGIKHEFIKDFGLTPPVDLIELPIINEFLKKYSIQLASSKGDLKAVEGEQQMLFGAFMIPDMEILRIDDTGKKYNVVFTKDTIKSISEKFALSNINTSLNEMHNNSMPIQGGVVQHFIIDSKNGIKAPFSLDLPDGTWAGFIKVLDKNKWDTFIKTGIYTGFSVEGFFYEKPVKSVSDAENQLMNDFLNQMLSH